jgi:hypothetical protein
VTSDAAGDTSEREKSWSVGVVCNLERFKHLRSHAQPLYRAWGDCSSLWVQQAHSISCSGQVQLAAQHPGCALLPSSSPPNPLHTPVPIGYAGQAHLCPRHAALPDSHTTHAPSSAPSPSLSHALRRLCPADKQGKRTFAPVMLRRLAKLGITKTDPNDLTPEERSAFVRLDIDPASITWRRVMDINDRWVEGGRGAGGGIQRTGRGCLVAMCTMRAPLHTLYLVDWYGLSC